METNKLEKVDLGRGFNLVFQKNSSGDVRAVVKNASGAIVNTGPIVEEKDAEVSKRKAMFDFLSEQMPSAPPRPDPSDPADDSYGEDEEDEEEEEEEEEEEDD